MRYEDWPDLMESAIERHRALPFGWCVSDCLQFPLDVAVAITGFDPRAADPPGYVDLDGAMEELHRRGWENIADAFAAYYEPVHSSQARRGDIGVAAYPGAEVGGGVVIVGTEVLARAEGRGGLLRLSRVRLTHAFRVGW